jgi:hypothetical protein
MTEDTPSLPFRHQDQDGSGDLLWHANLLRAGKVIEEPGSTRTSLVVSGLSQRSCVIPDAAIGDVASSEFED